ncbi:MAG: ATP-binding protein [Deltaproteobacteria bacterium]|nr:MAG: ATP-binding protein [Deltaproteobacteria bacterium]
MRFVDRKEELEFLEAEYRQPSFRFIPLYGRRRVGKTRLVQELIKDKPAIYFLADTVSGQEQLKNLGRSVGEYFQDRILIEGGFRDWEQFFRYIREKSTDKRLVLAIDEFPYLVSATRAISSIFQKGIDTHLKDTRLFLILLGSSIGMMEREVLFSKAPLYGRRTGSLKVEELKFRALQGFFPEADLKKRAAIFSTFGTIPAYLEQVRPHESILRNISELILSRNTFLHNEVEFLLREEFREPRDYYVILRAIAQGKRKLAELMNDTGFDKAHLSRYLDILRSRGFVEKEVPATEKSPDKSRLGLYRMHDRFFSFWFKYVLPNRGRLEIGNADYVLKLIQETLDQHVGDAYESISRETFLDMALRRNIPITSLGRWWSKNEEIDLVALDEESRAIWFGECKWSGRKVGTDIFRNLQRKAGLVEWHTGKRKERFILFSRSGFTPAMLDEAKRENVVLVEGEGAPDKTAGS